jgi:hypothetical protein
MLSHLLMSAEETPGGGGEDSRTYIDWQQALERAFLQPRDRTAPFVFFVDDDELDRLWPGCAAPALSLCRAVNQMIDWPAGTSLFRKIAYTAARHRRGDEPPLTLPLLAVTVLAATRMHQDTSFTASAYFVRLAQALRPDAEGPHLRELGSQLSQGFGLVAELWRDFHQWLQVQGRFGVSTIHDHPRLTRIGYPLSQALVRSSDRMRLTQFFAALELGQRGVPPRDTFRTYLGLWSSGPRGLSEAFRAALADSDLADIVTEQVQRLAESWDGVVLNPGGKRRLELRLLVDLETFTCRWTAAVVPGVAADTLHSDDGDVIELREPVWGSLYDISGAPPPDQWLKKRVSLTGSRCSAVVDLPGVFALREDADAGGWVSTDGVEPYEEHLLVIAPELQAAVEAVLQRSADPGWRLVRQRPPHQLIATRCIYRSVRLSSASAFEQLAGELGNGLGRSLQPDTPPRPRLVNGLRIATKLGHNHYLADGEPDLLLPVGAAARRVAASLDGHEQRNPFLATGFPIPLRRTGPLPAGRHELVADAEALVFHVLEGAQEEAPPAAAGWVFEGGGARLRATAEPHVAGARLAGTELAGTGREPLLLRRIREYLVAGRDGEFRAPPVPGPSEWAARHGLPASQYWEFVPGADDVWLVEFRRGEPRQPALLHWREPAIPALGGRSRQAWAAIGNRWASCDRLLDLYLKAVRPS